MAALVISGSGRGAGKTAVGCALIQAMPELRWVAVKVTPHGHDIRAGLWEETDRFSKKDTGRYLAAGAERAFLLATGNADSRTTVDWVLEARRLYAGEGALLIESGRFEAGLVADPDEPVLRLTVLGSEESEWKPSMWPRLASADALVLSGTVRLDQLPPELRQKPEFRMVANEWSTPELVAFVRAQLRLVH